MLGQYHIDHQATVGTLRNYDPQKQVYLFMSHKDPTRPIIVPQEFLNFNEDYLLHSNIPTDVQELHPYFQKILSGPLNDTEHAYYTTLVQKRCTHQELMYIIAKFSPFLYKKQYKYGSLSSKIEQSSSDFTFKTPATPPNITINSFSFTTKDFVNEIFPITRITCGHRSTYQSFDYIETHFQRLPNN